MIGSLKAVRSSTGSAALDGLLFSMLLLIIMAIAALMLDAPSGIVARAKLHPGAMPRVVPPAVVPQVEPIALRAMTADEARAFNSAIPFSTQPNPAARPFKFTGGEEDRLRALDCLAAAVLYEAGDDPVGQRAVAQVVLNRVRHPAFPKTVCGVVFQGSERRTGCQFTFTCDGALIRSYTEPLWQRARLVADAALSGSVYKPVGQATHYHTDWVVPYWSSSLDKIVAIHTHLFFRWTGWWGTAPAFRFGATGIEPRIGQLALRFPEHASLDGLVPASEASPGLAPVGMKAAALLPSTDNPNTFLVLLSAKDAASFPEIAAFACGSRAYCKFMGWTDPAKLPHDGTTKLTSEQLAAISFNYLRVRSTDLERALWNCDQFERPDAQCMWSKSSPPKTTAPPAVPAETTVKPLDGVRFKSEQRLVPKPAPGASS